jgi:hypothetical protein
MNYLFMVCVIIGGLAMQNVQFGSSIIIPGVTKGKPFEAEFEEIVSKKLPDGQNKQFIMRGKVYRDTEGRSCREIRREIAPGIKIDLAFIQDPIKKAFYILDRLKKTVAMKELSEADLTESQLPEIPDKEARMSQIEGISCYLYGFTLPEGEKIEACISKDLNIVMFEKSLNKEEEKIIRLFNIHLIKPDSTVFTVPSDYTKLN